MIFLMKEGSHRCPTSMQTIRCCVSVQHPLFIYSLWVIPMLQKRAALLPSISSIRRAVLSGWITAMLCTVSSSIVSQPCWVKCCLWLLLIGTLSPPHSYLISQARFLPTASQQQRQKPNHFVIQDASLKFFILITSCSWHFVSDSALTVPHTFVGI